jgi:hypothetical protein
MDPNALFDIVSEACQSNQKLNDFQIELITKISDLFASIDDREFTKDATMSQRCEFVLANRDHFMTYVDAQQNQVFSLEEIELISNTNTSLRNELINELLIEKGIPETQWGSIKLLLVTSTVLFFLLNTYFDTSYGISSFINFGKDIVNWPGTFFQNLTLLKSLGSLRGL